MWGSRSTNNKVVSESAAVMKDNDKKIITSTPVNGGDVSTDTVSSPSGEWLNVKTEEELKLEKAKREKADKVRTDKKNANYKRVVREEKRKALLKPIKEKKAARVQEARKAAEVAKMENKKRLMTERKNEMKLMKSVKSAAEKKRKAELDEKKKKKFAKREEMKKMKVIRKKELIDQRRKEDKLKSIEEANRIAAEKIRIEKQLKRRESIDNKRREFETIRDAQKAKWAALREKEDLANVGGMKKNIPVKKGISKRSSRTTQLPQVASRRLSITKRKSSSTSSKNVVNCYMSLLRSFEKDLKTPTSKRHNGYELNQYKKYDECVVGQKVNQSGRPYNHAMDEGVESLRGYLRAMDKLMIECSNGDDQSEIKLFDRINNLIRSYLRKINSPVRILLFLSFDFIQRFHSREFSSSNYITEQDQSAMNILEYILLDRDLVDGLSHNLSSPYHCLIQDMIMRVLASFQVIRSGGENFGGGESGEGLITSSDMFTDVYKVKMMDHPLYLALKELEGFWYYKIGEAKSLSRRQGHDGAHESVANLLPVECLRISFFHLVRLFGYSSRVLKGDVVKNENRVGDNNSNICRKCVVECDEDKLAKRRSGPYSVNQCPALAYKNCRLPSHLNTQWSRGCNVPRLSGVCLETAAPTRLTATPNRMSATPNTRPLTSTCCLGSSSGLGGSGLSLVRDMVTQYKDQLSEVCDWMKIRDSEQQAARSCQPPSCSSTRQGSGCCAAATSKTCEKRTMTPPQSSASSSSATSSTSLCNRRQTVTPPACMSLMHGSGWGCPPLLRSSNRPMTNVNPNVSSSSASAPPTSPQSKFRSILSWDLAL